MNRDFSSLLHRHAWWLAPVIGLSILTLILWGPFGIRQSDLVDAWPLMGEFDRGHISLIAGGQFRMRPFSLIPNVLGYWLSPDSFVGLNLIQIAAFWGKGLMLYTLMRRLVPDNQPLAWVAAVLLPIYPADTGLFTMRAVGMHVALFLFLLSLYLLVVYWQRPSALILTGMCLTLLLSLGISEVAYPLVLFAPLLLVWLGKGYSSRLVRVAGFWYLPAVLMFVYMSYVFSYAQENELYQKWAFMHSGLNSSDVIPLMWRSFVNGYLRHFWTGWMEALQQIRLDSPCVYLAAGYGALAGIICRVLSLHRESTAPRSDAWRYLWLALIGVLAVGPGFLIFVVSPFRGETWRVYYYSSIGAAIAVSAVWAVISRYARDKGRWYATISGLLIGLATLHALNQHAHYAEISHYQQVLLAGIVGQAPRFEPGAHLVVVDTSGRYHDNWTLGVSHTLTDAVQYVYADYDLEVILCYREPDGSWGTLPELMERCDFRAEELVLHEGQNIAAIWPYSGIVVMTYSEAEGMQLLECLPAPYLRESGGETYNPHSLIDAEAPPPRVYTLFSRRALPEALTSNQDS